MDSSSDANDIKIWVLMGLQVLLIIERIFKNTKMACSKDGCSLGGKAVAEEV